MGFFTSTQGSIISDSFKLVERHANLGPGIMYDVALYDDHLVIKVVGSEKSASLKYDQITDVAYTSEIEKISVDKSPIGRAIAGGLIFGGVGAVVGAISGTGKKQKTKVRVYFIISYVSSFGEDQCIVFEDTRMYRGSQVAAKLKMLTKKNDSMHMDL